MGNFEPCNPVENTKYRLASPQYAVNSTKKYLDRYGSGFGLMADAYHWSMVQADPLELLKQNIDLIKHVQIADCPGRNEPGTGQVNFQGIFDYLNQINYSGFIGLEYKPKADTKTGFAWINN